MKTRGTSRAPIKVRTSKVLTEKEALALLSTAVTRGSIFDAAKNEIFRMVNSGQHFGSIVPSLATGEPMNDEDGRACSNYLNADFAKRNFQFGVRFVPTASAIVFAPLAKIKELFGK